MYNYMYNSMYKKIAAAGFLFLLALNVFAAEGASETAATRRFGIFIGSNNGGRDRVMLRYAVSDAKSVSRIFSGMGGIAGEDNILMVEPSVREINRQIDNMGKVSAQAQRNAQRTELVFYYSGHSDENGLLLNRERYGYRELRERINAIQADMKIVILDSCSSGAITRAKGGVKTQPFLFDSSVSTAGYAILTSSSENEASQESDSIESSYFTHSLLAGLRGAADSVGDGRVTLNELYRYAYVETLAQTETSVYGAQHPSYDIQISGSGDVVLTDIKEISASLLVSGDITGRISIRDSSDFLVAELTKTAGKPLELGLEPGNYSITLQRGDNFYRTAITLVENKRTTLEIGQFQMIAAASGNRNRGDTPDSETTSDDDDDDLHHIMNLQILPGFDMLGHSWEKATNNILVGTFVGIGHNVNGVGAASIGLVNTGHINGVQASGIFNYAEGDIRGIQGAGIVNFARGDVWWLQGAGIGNVAVGNIQGIQGSGIFNYALGTVRGIQGSGVFNYANTIEGVQTTGGVNINRGGHGVMAGIVNISESEYIIPIGLVNIMKNGILHPAVYVDDMLFTNLSFRSGSKHFYGIVSMGVGGEFLYNRADDFYFTSRAGLGFEYCINKFFMNIDALSGNIYNPNKAPGSYVFNNDFGTQPDDYNTQLFQLRLTAGYKIFEHLGLFGGVSYDCLYRWDGNSLSPKDFGGAFIGSTSSRGNTHKLGFFGGIQF